MIKLLPHDVTIIKLAELAVNIPSPNTVFCFKMLVFKSRKMYSHSLGFWPLSTKSTRDFRYKILEPRKIQL